MQTRNTKYIRINEKRAKTVGKPHNFKIHVIKLKPKVKKHVMAKNQTCGGDPTDYQKFAK